MRAIDPKWLDVDFVEEAEKIGKPTGCLDPPRKPGDVCPLFKAEWEYPEDEWKDRMEALGDNNLRKLVKKIKDQGQEGSCTSNATAQCYEILLNWTYGFPEWIEFSPMSLYRWVASGPSSGSGLGDNIRQVSSVGLLPTRNEANTKRFEHTHPNTGYYTTFQGNWKSTAKHFRLLEWFEITTKGQMASAGLHGWPFLYGRKGHAICGVGLRYENGRWIIPYANSWDGDWGDDGFGYDTLSSSLLGYGAYACRAIVTPSILRDQIPVPRLAL